tara:strand:- start:326 stop:775 length:450 start_codon:yes stop_codon:yes gene_type:complete
VNKRIAHNLTWIPIFLIGILTISLGAVWFIHEQPWLLDKSPNEVLLQTSFDVLLSEKINIGLPSYLTIVYRFLGLYMLTIGSLIIGYVYVTRLGTKIARNCIFLILFITLLGIYFLVLNYLPSSPLMPVLYFLTFCLFLSVFFSKHLPD